MLFLLFCLFFYADCMHVHVHVYIDMYGYGLLITNDCIDYQRTCSTLRCFPEKDTKLLKIRAMIDDVYI